MDYPIELFKGGESRKIENSGQEAVARAQGFTEPYKYQEYPKHLYKGGTREVHEVTGEQVSADARAVKSKAEEAAARADGYRMLGEPATEPEKKDEATKKVDGAQGSQDDAGGKDEAKAQPKGKNAK